MEEHKMLPCLGTAKLQLQEVSSSQMGSMEGDTKMPEAARAQCLSVAGHKPGSEACLLYVPS